ncbi:porin family protein [Desulfurivibrio dismutans]|uniref:porin family protein n=1 Tax=Desulfurivibrio dismutans TaxID=1398908 RepID=UPI0023DCB8FC|nr:porin family protein [Desulfurivibrio alkaliphilus]MDF1615652.1 porin family protein [Desulfurivibrio alkaliphilus]
MEKQRFGCCLAALALLALVLFSTPLPAAADPVATGRQLLAERQYDEAYQLLHSAFRADPGHPEINFMLGRAAFESGRTEEAVMAYERVLLHNPEANRAKLELARSYMRLGSRELARQYFHEVLATNPPEAVWQNIQRFLAAMDAAEKRHFLNGLVTVGVGHDDNVNTFPGNDTVRLNGFQFDLDGEEKSNWLLNTNLVVNHIYRPRYNSPLNWKTSFTNYNAFHESANDMDLNLFGLSTGPTWRRDRLLLQAAVSFTHVDLGFDRYLGMAGLSAGATWLLSPQWALNGGIELRDRDFYQNDDRDSTNLLISLGPVFSHGDNRLGLTLGYETDDADVEHHSYDRRRVTLRYDRKLPADFAAFAAMRYQETDYDDDYPLFNKARKDESMFYSLGVSKVFWRSGDSRRSFSGQLSYAYTDAESNIELFEYTKGVANLALTYTF